MTLYDMTYIIGTTLTLLFLALGIFLAFKEKFLLAYISSVICSIFGIVTFLILI
ncbi:MAG: hypothetical protein RUMPE_00949 [Eubacteriales bacterium SKADARSKE-1]|nr:hypothetical protein [Eubacteriales bacterium SKADARSKE-1]